MKVFQYPAHTSRYVTGRNSQSILGVVLVPVSQDIDSFLSEMKSCPISSTPPCFSGFHYAYDPTTNKLYQLVDIDNSPYLFDQSGDCEVPEASPFMPGTGNNPNYSAVSVAIMSNDGTVFNQDCDVSTALTAAQKANLKCVISEVLAEAQTVTSGLTTTDIYIFDSVIYNTAAGDRGSLFGTTLVALLAAVCGIATEAALLAEAAIRAAALQAEVTTATDVLTEDENGKILFLNSATEFVTTLPLPFLGGKFTVIVKAAPSGASYTVVTKNSANILLGHILSSDLNASGDSDSEVSGGDTLSFVDGKAVVGDRADFVSDGTKWYVRASCVAFDAITITTAS